MAKLPPKKSEENANEWLNTYADMVTLLLTFFVLLFACSNLDETKLQLIFQAFQSRGQYLNTQVDNLDINASETGGVTDVDPSLEGGDGEMPQSFEELYQYFVDYIDENNLSDSIMVENGAAHITIRFDDDVFFDGNSYILKEAGRRVLNGIIPGIRAVQGSIQTMTISGHTADDGTDKTRDMQLSALRANSVHLHLMSKDTIEYSKYRLKACGPNEPIESNDTREGMAKNRRVEIMFIKSNLNTDDPDVIKDILEHDYGLGSGQFDPETPTKPEISKLPEGSVDKVIGTIEDELNNSGSVLPTENEGPSIIDSSVFVTGTDDDSEAE
ncbi:MAG: OmpA family protein [Oscillospiraceae bacterium]|nr:OmpA family protein [Oscillospiraceae bacterium]